MSSKRVTADDALTLRIMHSQGEPATSLAEMLGYSVDEVERALRGEVHPEVGGPFTVKGPLHPDNQKGSKKAFAKAVLCYCRDAMEPERFFMLCSTNGLTVNEVMALDQE